MDHYSLVCDIGELSALFHEALDLQTFLDRTVHMVADHCSADVCSIYLYDTATRTVSLRATHGLNEELVGQVRLGWGEGLTGMAIKQLYPIAAPVASENLHYRFVPGLKEEQFEAFLAVPLARGINRVGVLVVQRDKRKPFRRTDVQGLRAVASQLTGAIENARLLMAAASPHHELREYDGLDDITVFEGPIASGGLARGPSFLLDREGAFETLADVSYPPGLSQDDFRAALLATEAQLEEMQQQVGERLSDVASLIFSSHLLILKDPSFTGDVERLIESGTTVPRAVLQIAESYVRRFQASSVGFVREKAQDVKDLVTRLLGHLRGGPSEAYDCAGHIVVAREIFPSGLLRLSSERAAGVILVTGGVTSHIAILARSLGMPLVIVDDQRLLSVTPQTDLLLDADLGKVYVAPGADVVERFATRLAAHHTAASAREHMQPRTVTADGHRVRLLANVNLMSDADLARELSAEGIGLYRTEFPFMTRRELPTEEEQFELYRELVSRFPNGPINFRTLDIGGDKVLSYYADQREQNPFLGMRSIRFSLRNQDIFAQQVRAMLRASAGRQLRIMFPLVSSLDELTAGRAIVEQCAANLRDEDYELSDDVQIGAMAEVPSILPLIDEFVQLVDFISIGTNDLVQYLLAVDRTNEKVAGLYLPHHPAVLRSLRLIVNAAVAANIEVSVCGDMAHEERYLPFLVGIGVEAVSVEPVYLPAVQAAVQRIELAGARQLAEQMLAATTIEAVEALLPRPSIEAPVLSSA